jgi:hypothetical protein
MRRAGLDLESAAAEYSMRPEEVRQWAPLAFSAEGDLISYDWQWRPMKVYSGGRVIVVDVSNSIDASNIGRYHAAVRHYLHTGDGSHLVPFEGWSVNGIEVDTDLDVLDEMARQGVFDFDSIYVLGGDDGG